MNRPTDIAAPPPLPPDLMKLLYDGYQFQLREQFEDAARCYRKILKRAPDNADVLNLLGMVRARQNRFDDAIDLYRSALARKPGDAKAWFNLGLAYSALERHPEGAEAMAQAHALDAGLHEAVGMLLSLRRAICDWRDHDLLMESVAASGDPARPPVSPFFTLWLDDPEVQRAAAQRAVEKKGLAQVSPTRHDPAARRPGPIRVGYVSADFRDHPTTHLMSRLVEIHDRSRFEITAFSLGPEVDSPYRRRIVEGADRFVSCPRDAPAVLAAKIRDCGIDILVDVMGHTTGNRMEAFAFRPAPVQVSYLAYPGTTGAGFMDYVIADPVVVPFSNAPFFTESIVHLPDAYQPNDPTLAPAPRPTRTECGLPEDGFVFSMFNNVNKLEPETFSLFMRLLRAVPGSVLWVLARHTQAQDNLRREAEARGVDGARILFAPPVPLEQHLARLPLADLFLDTFPYTAHTTASDALRMGLPLITRRGRTFASRVAASLLHQVGLGECVAATPEEFEALALGLAGDAALLAAIRDRLGESLSSPLFDIARYTRHLESAYERMMERWLSGTAPAPFAVPILEG
ncbi:tetratricopeptide repeat protein [Aquabacter sp. CN5-332]|uniref:O-linked N-acetylglucosamine transferase, SPINDLY family protein n=1 Tax=Aquabacter sp. CN5-332 TaxID=3156608 RepID=UPI0032B403AD